MENNSNDSLLGFSAVADVFADHDQQMEMGEDLDDDVLEQLKQQSASARPSIPGTKKDKENETSNTTTEPIEDSLNGQNQSTDQTTQTGEATGDVAATADGEEGGEEAPDEAEVSGVTALFDAISDELGWTFSEEEEADKPKSVADLVDYFTQVIMEQSVPTYANQEVAALDEFVRNGGRLQDYFSQSTTLDLDRIDMEEESNQRTVLHELLARQGYEEDQIKRKLDRFEDAGVLEDEAKDALEDLKEITEEEHEQLLQNQKIRQQQYQQRQQQFFNDVVNEISSLDNIRGIKVPTKDKQELLAYIFKADANGVTQYQRDYSSSVRNLVESAYFTMRRDTLIDNAKKQGNNTALNNLKNSLRSTGVNKGTKRINTNPSDSIFSRAVQLL